MAELSQIVSSYPEVMAPKLMEQYKPHTAPKLNQLLEAIGAQKDDLESALFSIRNGLYLATAEGVQLDTIGAVFNVARLGNDDETYRSNIRQVASMRSFATPEDIISVLKSLYGATSVAYIPEYPAGAAILTDNGIDASVLELLAPAGVRVSGASFLVDYDGNNIVDYDGNFIYGIS